MRRIAILDRTVLDLYLASILSYRLDASHLHGSVSIFFGPNVFDDLSAFGSCLFNDLFDIIHCEGYIFHSIAVSNQMVAIFMIVR